ncbi:MAG: fructose-6-phosphate aldolase [Candidatus Altarchaeaceae archaeon]
MKIFIDTANLDQIREMCEIGIIDGVTTNPTLIAKEKENFKKWNIENPKQLIKEICDIVKGPVSMEALSEDTEGIINEAREYSKISEHVVIKIPMTKNGLKAVKILSKENIKTNVTLIFSPSQALLAAKVGATYVSPFIGRLDDISHYGMDIIADIRQIFDNYDFQTEIIVASIRNPLHVVDAAKYGADIATVPFDVLEKMFSHPLTNIGIERFKNDYKKLIKE